VLLLRSATFSPVLLPDGPLTSPDAHAPPAFLPSAIARFRQHKQLGDGALAQCSDADLVWCPADDANSIATIVRHMRGNMLSRWTDFLTSDGEKPWRHRDTEFEDVSTATTADILAWWEEGWACLFAALEPLREDDLARTITIRNEPHTVLDAIHRQLAHYAYHTGQIVLLARIRRGAEWTTLSVPRGGSAAFNKKMGL